jgi:hypothetical protein
MVFSGLRLANESNIYGSITPSLVLLNAWSTFEFLTGIFLQVLATLVLDQEMLMSTSKTPSEGSDPRENSLHSVALSV